MRQELNVLALIKARERFIYVYDDDSRERLLRRMREQAADPVSGLNWFDVAVLTERVREQAPRAADEGCGHEPSPDPPAGG